MRRLIKFFPVCLLVLLFTIAGVSAKWVYYPDLPSAQRDTAVQLGVFAWKSEVILPNTDPGENHLALIRDILQNRKNGLNSSKDAVEDAVIAKEILYSYDNIQGGNLKHLFETSETRKLDFVLEKITDTEFYVFTYLDEDLENKELGVDMIEVYRTTYVKTGDVWDKLGSTRGMAVVFKPIGKSFLAINPATWTNKVLV